MKNNLEVPKGITHSSCHLTSQILSDLAVKVGLELEDGKDRNRSCIESIVEDKAKRSGTFSTGCSFANCLKNKVIDRPPSIHDSKYDLADLVEEAWTKVVSRKKKKKKNK